MLPRFQNRFEHSQNFSWPAGEQILFSDRCATKEASFEI
jgi:hypothetical protein